MINSQSSPSGARRDSGREMIYFAAGFFVIGIALFKRELLFRTKSFRIILAISAVMFFIGTVLSVAKPEPKCRRTFQSNGLPGIV